MMTSLEKLGKKIYKNGIFLEDHNECSYIVSDTIREVKEYIEKTVESGPSDYPQLLSLLTLYVSYLERIWSRNVSAASLELDFSQQLGFISAIAKSFIKVGKGLERASLTNIIDGSSILRRHYEMLKRGEEPPSMGPIKQIDLSKIPMDAGRRLVELIIKYRGKVIRYYDRPVALLKGGFRSFCFLNFDDIVLTPDFSGQLYNLYDEIIQTFQKRMSSLGKDISKEDITILFLAKESGEVRGSQSTVPVLSARGYNCAVLLLDRFYRKDYRLYGDVKGNYVIVIDDMVTRGTTAKQVRFILENMGIHNIFYTALFVRGDRGKADDLNIWPLVTTSELAASGLWIPDILMISLKDPIWASIDLKQDYLLEIFSYLGSQDRYQKFFVRFENLILQSYKDVVSDVEFEGDVLNYLINITLLIWGRIFELQSHEPSLNILSTADLLEDFLDIEESVKFSSSVVQYILKKKIKDDVSLFYRWDYLHRIFVKNIDKIIYKVNNKFSKTKKQIGIPVKKPQNYSKEEIDSMIMDHLRIIKEKCEMEGISYTSEEELKEKESLEELYRLLNEEYGKDEETIKWWNDFLREVDQKYEKYIASKRASQ